jgi:hypothetical protein
MSKATRKPNQGDTVVVVSEDFTYTGVVTDVLSSQFIYEVTHVNNQRSPSSHAHSWKKFCFFTDDWKIKKIPIDHSLQR